MMMMMMMNTISIVLSAFLAVHITGADFGQVEPRDRWDDAELALADFINEVQLSINQSMVQLDRLTQTMSVESARVKQIAGDALDDLEDEIVRELDKIRDLANQSTAVTIERCIMLFGAEMVALPIDTGYAITKCIDGYQDLGLEGIDKTREEVQGSINMAGDFRRDIDGCRLSISSEECISRVFISILMSTLEVPTNNEENVRRAMDVVASVVVEMPSCAMDRVRAAVEESVVLLTYVKNCAGIN